MKHIARQLEHVRRTSRWLLLLRRAAQWVAVLVPTAIGLGLLDYLFRLPGAMRLGLGGLVLGVALAWLATRLARAYRFWPSIPELALRAERLYPQLAGSLASAVAFSSNADDYETPRAHTNTATMARRAVDDAEAKLGQVDLYRLIKTRPTLKAALLALLSLAVLGTIAGAAPSAASTAAQRWLLPLGDAQWPYRQAIESLTENSVRPVDGRVRLRAKVTRGYADGMKMTIAYRVVGWDGSAGEWERVRVAEQRSIAVTGQRGVFETLVDVPAPVVRSLMSGEQDGATLEYRFEAGDFTTDTAELTLAARPEVVSVVATVTPPAYAQGLLSEQTVPMHEQQDAIATASAYVGSRVELRVLFNKPVPETDARRAAEALLAPAQTDPTQADAPAQPWRDASIALHQADGIAARHSGVVTTRPTASADGFTITGTLVGPVLASFEVTDSYGLGSTGGDRQYRLQVIADEAPVVVLLDPMVDESVLPTASVALQAMAEDDVAVQALLIEVVAPDRANTDPDAEQLAARVLDDPGLLSTGRSGTLELQHVIDLGTLDLLPGDEVFVTAVGQDVYDLDGQRHTPARSATRRLRVITEQELAEQVRRVLRGVRDTAQSLERTQRILSQRNRDGADPAETAAQQGEVTGRLSAQRDQVDALRDRLERNGAQDLGPLRDLLDQADRLLDDAQDASGAARDALEQSEQARQRGAQAQQQQAAAQQAGDSAGAQAQQQAAEQARAEQGEQQQQAGEAQEQVQRGLNALVAALDMGESIGEVESALADLQRDAQRVAEDTQELLPQTIGRSREDLPQELQDRLDRNAADQRAIGERAEALLDQMRSTAQQIAEQGEQQGATPQQRAAAQTMQEAAAVGERQGLEDNTQQAAEELQENQVAEAATRQQQAQSTLEQMLAEMGRQQQRQQEELRRLLRELAQKVQKLIDDQASELARVQQVQPGGLAALEPALVQLRRRVMLVEEEAVASAETAAAGAALGKAVASQARAVRAMRGNDAPGAEAEETEALAHLRDALQALNEAEHEQQQEQQRAERAALRQAYYDLAERQETLRGAVAQHERDEPYGRRDWRQVNQLHAEALDGAAFDAAQDAVRSAALVLGGQAGEAMVYQSLHRRIDQAAERAHRRLRERRADALVVAEQGRVAAMLRAMGDALDDVGNPEKFEREQQQQQQGGGGGGGQGEPPPLVPDLAEIKLLREVQIDLRRQTEMIDRLADQLTPEELQQRLQDLSAQQQELSELGEQLIEKLQAMMGGDGPPTPEDRE
jgi:hypothetical protein